MPPAPTPTAMPTETPQPIQVYVTGQVIEPDVYVLAPGSRIKQLVEAAGGFTDDANTAAINLAQPLVDGAHVHVPALSDEPASSPPVVSDPVPLRSDGANQIEISGNLININVASKEELETLPGIGPVTAQKIIDYRQINGAFTRIESIMEVPGIGEGKFEQIKALITAGA
ncbi:MAG: ComEA family DNA-binding protein [Candidatus Promineifilaceae bacterium]|nr:ComEA family DNA-binding protein [Candidatus Promineifilaceae bacterium]